MSTKTNNKDTPRSATFDVIRMKKITVSVVAGLLVIAIAWFVIRPPMPEKWNALEPGMSRAEVLEAFPEMVTGMYEVKGLDTILLENRLPWFPRGYWMASLSYSEDEKVDVVGYHYVNRVMGLFNVTRIKE